ncbi:MAG: type I-C CRISPR-associated protein Cas7/Csd2 [Oscillospiraceae bacterium]|jgi:CRISPR-associated protein Csd2|nr:type I-C CRISPR-associated protein Cas7/Csd2 [Oscillospiraceae bacterium]
MSKLYENAIQNRYDFVILYDVENGNPNGDPDAGNMPRTDPETGRGIVTDVCIKRKIRNYIDLVKDGEPGYDIYIKQDVSLNSQDAKGVSAVKDIKDKAGKSESFRDFMCKSFFDIRTFGAVMTTAAKDNDLSNVAGQVRGPVQLAFGKSVDPISPQEVTITRVAITTDDKAATASTEMGRKHIVPYGLYRQEGFVSANLAERVTGFSEADLELLWTAITHMFDDDRSAARGIMTLRELIIFKHAGRADSGGAERESGAKLGCAPSHRLFELVTVARRGGVAVPRAYADYEVTVGDAPAGVEIIRRDV